MHEDEWRFSLTEVTVPVDLGIGCEAASSSAQGVFDDS